VGLNEASKSSLPREVDAELENFPGLAGVYYNLFRDANSEKTQLLEKYQLEKSNVVKVCISKEYETKEHRNARPLSLETSIQVDGLYVLFLDHDRMSMEKRRAGMERVIESAKAHPAERVGRRDLILVATGEQFTAEFCNEYAEAMKPFLMIVSSSISKVGRSDVEAFEHNTLAVAPSKAEPFKTRFVSLGTTPYEMSEEVADLFAKKEAAQKASREMFAKLSVDQMNFKPNNGSHTPRWNTEHMMGRELVFFSQIYNAVDPSIPVMDLNPKQMPKDYEFAHPDWTGAEEARQMKRVEDFTRRFAYLLDGMDLDKKAKGSRFWTPRRLLMQMERHYKEHSANVVKKMKLEGWPKE